MSTLALSGSQGGCWSLSQQHMGEGRVHLNESSAHLWDLREHLGIWKPQWCSECVPAPPPATRTPLNFCPHLGLRPEPP